VERLALADLCTGSVCRRTTRLEDASAFKRVLGRPKSLAGSGVPADEGEEGTCVCEFEEVFGMGQSKVSYHVKKLKDAGLVREERRGKWAFYPLDREAASGLLAEAADRLLSAPEKRSVADGC
jgi:DNA-binding transcriptional ArsR family regulator